MAGVTVTAADVKPLPGAEIHRYDAGGTVAAGEAVYLASDGDVERADADASASSQAIGVAVVGRDGKTSFSAGDRVDVVVRGRVAGFSSLTPGALHYASTTAGEIESSAPAGSSSDYKWIIGRAVSAAVLDVFPFTDDFAAQ